MRSVKRSAHGSLVVIQWCEYICHILRVNSVLFLRRLREYKAVALNCGARVETAAAFYLPLPKIARVLELIQRGEKVGGATASGV